jgi:hypothetical protein
MCVITDPELSYWHDNVPPSACKKPYKHETLKATNKNVCLLLCSLAATIESSL